MDLSKLSNETLKILSEGKHPDYSKLPDEELNALSSAHQQAVDNSKNPEPPPEPDQSGGALQTASDLARGAGQGLSFGFSDEAVGAARALKDILTDPNAQNFLKQYRQRQQEEQQANEAAAQRSPIAYNVGDYGSTILSGLLSGGAAPAAKLGARGLANLALKGAAIGGAQGLGRSTQTIEENPTGLASDVAQGATAGAVLAPLLGSLSSKFSSTPVQKEMDAINKAASGSIEQSPLKAQLSQAYQAGKAGEGFNKTRDVISREAGKEQGAIKGIKDVFDTAEGKLLSNKKGLLESAEAVIQPEPDKVSQIQPFLDFASKSGEIAKKDLQEVADSLQLYAKGGLSPKAADATRKKVQEMASNVQDPNVRGSLVNLADELESGIEKTVPGYGEANSNIHEFLKAGRETLMSRGKEPEVSKLKVSNLGKEDLKTEQELQRILNTLRNYKEGATKESQGAVDKTMSNLQNLFDENPDLAQKLGINLPGLEKQIYNAADQTAVASKLIPGALGDLKPGSSLFGIPSVGQTGLLKGANIAGQIVKKSSDIYKLPKEGLVAAAQKLQESGVPGITSLGEGLASTLEHGDPHKTNATLFTILQNPTARKLLGYSPENQSQGENY